MYNIDKKQKKNDMNIKWRLLGGEPVMREEKRRQDRGQL
jgi:hypothetical protein